MEIETYLSHSGKLVVRFNADKFDSYQIVLEDADAKKLNEKLSAYLPRKEKTADNADVLDMLKSAIKCLDWLVDEPPYKENTHLIHDSHLIKTSNQLRECLAKLNDESTDEWFSKIKDLRGPIDTDVAHDTLRQEQFKVDVRHAWTRKIIVDESMPTNEIHVFGADGKKVIVKF